MLLKVTYRSFIHPSDFIMSSAEHLFVYGTLRDEINHPMSDLLQKYVLEVQSASFCGKLYDTGSFPAAVTSEDESDAVIGDLYTIKDPQSVFRHLDSYEGYNPHNPRSLFLRKKVSVDLQDNNQVSSWIYLYNRSTDNLPLIPGGDYLSYLKNKRQSSS